MMVEPEERSRTLRARSAATGVCRVFSAEHFTAQQNHSCKYQAQNKRGFGFILLH